MLRDVRFHRVGWRHWALTGLAFAFGLVMAGRAARAQTVLCDGVCGTGDDSFCPDDCGVTLGICGDGSCDPGEEGACPQDCGISCIGQSCAAGEYFDWDACACLPSEDTCFPETCPPGQTFDTQSCTCVGEAAPPPAAACGNGACEEGEGYDSCPADCPSPPPADNCGDGTCSAGEDFGTCPADCPAPAPISLCGDGVCAAGEETSCPRDCQSEPPLRACGDGLCDRSIENITNCAADCSDPLPRTAVCGDGVCEPPLGERFLTCGDCADLQVCGNGTCDTEAGLFTSEAETNANCPSDCPITCGDGVCGAEDTTNCPQDCEPEDRSRLIPETKDEYKGLNRTTERRGILELLDYWYCCVTVGLGAIIAVLLGGRGTLRGLMERAGLRPPSGK